MRTDRLHVWIPIALFALVTIPPAICLQRSDWVAEFHAARHGTPAFTSAYRQRRSAEHRAHVEARRLALIRKTKRELFSAGWRSDPSKPKAVDEYNLRPRQDEPLTKGGYCYPTGPRPGNLPLPVPQGGSGSGPGGMR